MATGMTESGAERYAIGVDLGGTNLRAAAVDGGGAMLERVELPTDVRRGRDAVIADLCSAVRRVMEQRKGSRAESLCGIGVGVAGLVDSETGRLLQSPNLPGWEEYDVRGEIERRLNAPVLLENDANVAALGEHWLGAGRGGEHLCMYTLGTGVGGGLVLDGKIWRGWNGMAAELGHCNVEPEGNPCNCGSRGCLEQYASAQAVERMAREAIASAAATTLRDLPPEALSAQAVYECAARGDAEAKKIFERMGSALGVAIADMVNALNLPLYVLGGGVAASWDAFAPALFTELRRRSFVFAGTTAEDGRGVGGRSRTTRICRAKLGGDGGLYGAARLPMLASAPHV